MAGFYGSVKFLSMWYPYTTAGRPRIAGGACSRGGGNGVRHGTVFKE